MPNMTSNTTNTLRLRVSFSVLVLLVHHCSCNCALAFVTKYSHSSRECSNVSVVRPGMVGGKGWENNSFLDSLGGSDEDQEKEKSNYYEQQESRKAFNKRQEERMKSPEAQKFMEDYRKRQLEQKPDDCVQDIMGVGNFDDPFGGAEASAASSGGTRLQGMMAKAKRQRQGPPGLEQKFAIPLDSPGDSNDADDK
mmetsp:Transcript_7257/g.14340  ORF Transcript_7257/g.14340 Transcript_7257/m.14340 type:complete len:195 (-) Transcript_7257:665-1249(-)